MAYTEEQQKKIDLVRLYIGDVPSSPFYPIFSDDEIGSILEFRGWNVKKGIRDTAISASMYFAQLPSRERVDVLEEWNTVAQQYQKALQDLISDNSVMSLDDGIMPYFGGISWEQISKINSSPDQTRSSLTWESHTIPLAAGVASPKQEWLDTDINKLIYPVIGDL